MDAQFVDEGQLLDLKEDENHNTGNVEDIELEGIAISQWDKRNELWLVTGDRDSKYFDSTIIVKWQDTEEDTELRSWPHTILQGTDGLQMWSIMQQHTTNIK